MRHTQREKTITKYVSSHTDVLDIGSTGQHHHYSLWNFLKNQTQKLTGIDVVGSEDSRIVVGNMEEYDFDKQFEVIVAGDVIEHVGNQLRFLENVAKHLRSDGVFILTTPNAKWPTVFLKPNPTHVLWHDIHTLRYVLKLSGLEIIDWRYYFGNKYQYPIWHRPLVWRQGLLAVCKKLNK